MLYTDIDLMHGNKPDNYTIHHCRVTIYGQSSVHMTCNNTKPTNTPDPVLHVFIVQYTIIVLGECVQNE